MVSENQVTFGNGLSNNPLSLMEADKKSNVKLTSFMLNDKRRISIPPKACSAVELRRLRYVVGGNRKSKAILSGINMTVPEGAIYGLLGPSGSGKTTLLKSVVGQIEPTEGWVKVFGFRPNTPGSQIPGPAIGYMPQELAIYEDFTIKETLWYFGRLYRISSELLCERIEFLLNFLDLPRGGHRLVVHMSGGQKRRVSLASALVHSPPLLILDEPTVGVDPLLRQSIWQHLVTLTQTEKITVIVTTHYIEEARRANVVGLMRRGRLLAENSPEELMARHKCMSLEDVFLKLCVTDSMRRTQVLAKTHGTNAIRFELGTSEHTTQQHKILEDEKATQSNVKSSLRFDGTKSKGDSLNSSISSLTTGKNGSDMKESCNIELTDSTTKLAMPEKKSINQLKSLFKSLRSNQGVSFDAEQRRQSGSFYLEQLMKLKSPVQLDVSRTNSIDHNNMNTICRYDATNSVNTIDSQNQDDKSLSGVMESDCVSLNETYEEPDLFMNHLSTMSPGLKYDYKRASLSEYCDTIGTITWKNSIRLKRNVPLLLFQFLLPAIQVILFCICVGNDPFDIPVAVVNDEISSVITLGGQFLNSIDNHMVRLMNYPNLTSGLDSVKSGDNWGVIHIPYNFTSNLRRRFTFDEDLTDEEINNSTIKIYPDMTNQPIGHAMDVAFKRAYSDLAHQTFELLGLNGALAEPPLKLEAPIYGLLDSQNYLQYMSPGVLISISYIMATGLTSLAFIIEKRDGLFDRTLAAGVDHLQMLLSHGIVQLVVMIVQISLVVFFTFVIYRVPSRGPFVWVFLLLLLQGLAGMAFGLMVSSICREENTAIMMILGTFYPNLLLAGVIWPVEAIPYWLRWFSYLQPQTLPTQSLRDLIVRGWDIDKLSVWSGFGVTFIWFVVFLIISCIKFKITK